MHVVYRSLESLFTRFTTEVVLTAEERDDFEGSVRSALFKPAHDALVEGAASLRLTHVFRVFEAIEVVG